MDPGDFPTTAVEFDERFGSEEACREYLMRVRWPAGFRCPGCGHARAWPLRRRHLLECASCGRQVSLTAGTVFHGTRKPLRFWFKAIFLAVAQKTGTSALNLQRQLGFGSYETAWTWMHKIRCAMVRPGRKPLSGTVEVDEAYVGGEERGVRGRETRDKSLVAVAVEVKGDAAGRLRMKQIEDASAPSLEIFVGESVALGSTVQTDGWAGYGDLSRWYRHRVRKIRDPRRASRLFPHVHRAISLLKRWILGTYQGSVSRKHLHAYLDEFAFRFNRRRSGRVTLPFERLCAIAVITPPRPYRCIVTQPVVVA